MAPLPLLRLLQLTSPTLPIGAFTYSQGLEWAVEAGWVQSETTLSDWLQSQGELSLMRVDLPLLKRLWIAAEQQHDTDFHRYSRELLAWRETAELRAEEQQRGRALTRLLMDLQLPQAEAWRESLQLTQAAGFALAATQWQIGLTETLLGYSWGWLENQVMAGVKLIPLGQTAGQRLLLDLGKRLPDWVEYALTLPEAAIGGSATALSHASARHEQQYTRLFRS